MPAAGWAAKSGDPVLWVTQRRDPAPPPATRSRRTSSPDIYVLGPPAAVSDAVLQQLAGSAPSGGSRARDPVVQRDRVRALLRRQLRLERGRPGARARVRVRASGRWTRRPRRRCRRAAPTGRCCWSTDARTLPAGVAGLSARHPARLRQGPGARRLQPRLDHGRRGGDLSRRAGAHRHAARDPARRAPRSPDGRSRAARAPRGGRTESPSTTSAS